MPKSQEPPHKLNYAAPPAPVRRPRRPRWAFVVLVLLVIEAVSIFFIPL